MKFEEALKCMREGKKVKYEESIYWIDEENEVVCYLYDYDDNYLDDSVVHIACLYGDDLMSEDWEIINE